jgi:hypothetical protein
MVKELQAEVCLHECELSIFLVTTIQPKLVKKFSQAGILDPEELVGRIFLSLCQDKRVFQELNQTRIEGLVLDLAAIATTHWFRELRQRNETQLGR